MRFWEIADARNPVFFHTKCVPERRWSTSAVRRVRDGLVCSRIMGGSWADHGRIGLGPWSDRFRIVNGVSSVFRACAFDRIPLWFATVGSFPQCKWDCKWCWWMSCRWSFEGSLARNAFLALVIFLLKIFLKSASISSFFRSGVEIRFWSYNFRRRCA